MSVKIRLQRHGKKGKPFYWIVAADARAKRDGRYLEKLGTYNPNTNPATVNLDIDGAVKWLQDGAQPTDTAKTILSYKGAMLKNHLVGGVRKGALTEEQAEEKFQAWVDQKAGKVASKEETVAKAKLDVKAKALEALMQKLQKEGKYIPLNHEMYKKAINATALYKLTPEQTTGKCKFGQGFNQERYERVSEHLKQRGTPKDLATLKLINEYRK